MGSDSEPVQRKDEDTGVNDSDAGIPMPCDTWEPIQALHVLKHDVKRGGRSSLRDFCSYLEADLESPKSTVLDMGDDFMHSWVLKFHMLSFSA